MRSLGLRHVTEVACLGDPCDWVLWDTMMGRGREVTVHDTNWKINYRLAVEHSKKTGHPVKIFFEQSITVRRRKHGIG